MSTQRAWQIATSTRSPPVKPRLAGDLEVGAPSLRHHRLRHQLPSPRTPATCSIPEHNESESGQQELYFVHRGSVRVTLDGEQHEAGEGAMIAIEPEVSRKIESTSSPTTLVAIGGTPGKAYEVGAWELRSRRA